MPVSYRFDGDLVEVVVEGDHDVEDFVRCLESVGHDPDWKGSAWLLVDVRRSPAVTRRTPKELKQVSQFMRGLSGTFRNATALLVSSTMQVETLSQNVQAAALDGKSVRAFYDRAEAIRWLVSRDAPVLPRSSDSGERQSVV